MANDHTPRAPKQRPDPRPMRLALGATGVAAFTALTSAIVGPGTPSTAPSSAAGGLNSGATVTADRTAPVIHVKRTVYLQPGQTPPPQAVVTQLPAPKPRTVVVVTSQSGARP